MSLTFRLFCKPCLQVCVYILRERLKIFYKRKIENNNIITLLICLLVKFNFMKQKIIHMTFLHPQGIMLSRKFFSGQMLTFLFLCVKHCHHHNYKILLFGNFILCHSNPTSHSLNHVSKYLISPY